MRQTYASVFLAALLVGASAAPSWKLPKAPADVGKGSSDDKDKSYKASILAGNPKLFKGTEDDATIRAMFEEWRATFKKSYPTTTAYNTAFANFKESLKRAAAINANKDLSFWSDLNTPMADISFATFETKYLMKKAIVNGVEVSKVSSIKPSGRSRKLLGKPARKPSPAPKPSPSPVASPQPSPAPSPAPSPIPAKDKDWRLDGKVTPVKDQGGCGSCWAFAASAAIESAYHITMGTNASVTPIDVSEQQMVSCANALYSGYFSDGCNGGGSDDAINYVFRVNQTKEGTYPYTSGSTGVTGVCSSSVLASILPGNALKLGGGVVYLARNSQQALMDAIDQQPVVIYFDVASDFYSYSSGVYSPSSGCMDGINHAMVAVGYKWTGSASTSYWIVRNSWGAWWGESGYIRVRMTGDGSGPCLMQTYPLAPVFTFTQKFA